MISFPEEYIPDIERAKAILIDCGVSEMFIFGSLATGKDSDNSDIDIAVRGLKADMFFFAYSKLVMMLDHEVDLVSLDDENSFSSYLVKSGSLERVF
ncbi:MAG: nucleotidyltransferase family protein [Saccharofermentanales bacterium]